MKISREGIGLRADISQVTTEEEGVEAIMETEEATEEEEAASQISMDSAQTEEEEEAMREEDMQEGGVTPCLMVEEEEGVIIETIYLHPRLKVIIS